MHHFIAAYWGLIIDVIVITTCGIVVIFFMKNKSTEDDLLGETHINVYRKKTDKKCASIADGDIPNPDRYGEVSRLARLGFTIKEISKQLRMPKGEVELVITLRK